MAGQQQKMDQRDGEVPERRMVGHVISSESLTVSIGWSRGMYGAHLLLSSLVHENTKREDALLIRTINRAL